MSPSIKPLRTFDQLRDELLARERIATLHEAQVLIECMAVPSDHTPMPLEYRTRG
jgi:hypothetical protein